MIDNANREQLIEKLVSNLPAIRAKMKVSQVELADILGIGRQTLISIENRKSKMRWDTFLATMMVMSKDKEASELLSLLGLNTDDLGLIIEDSLVSRKASSLQEKMWTDNNYSGDTTINGIVPLPVGLRNSKCPKCNSANIRGVLIMPTADEQDPNIMCFDCGYWWD